MFSSLSNRNHAPRRNDRTRRADSDASDVHTEASISEVQPSQTSTDDSPDTAEENPVTAQAQTTATPVDLGSRASAWKRILAYGVLPGLALILAMGAGYVKWKDGTLRESQVVAMQSVAEATESTIALLSYKPETVDKDLGAAHDRVTGPFKEAYTRLVHDVVIPGAKQKQISTVATVPAAASVTANADHAVVLVFVDQTTTVGNDAPTNTASSGRVTLDKIGGRWLISQFDPV